jgi:TatD DNase family protein
MLVDSHCHLDRLDLERFGGLAGVLETAEAHGVTRLLSVATDLESWPALARLTEPYPQIALSVGVHPSEDGGRAPTKAALTALGRESRVVAIGETGLDYHYGADSADRQRDWFRVHIAAARELGKPLIVHTRAARADTLRILKEEGAAEVGGVLHCFTEDWAMAEQALALELSRLVFRHRHLQERPADSGRGPATASRAVVGGNRLALSGAGSASG